LQLLLLVGGSMIMCRSDDIKGEPGGDSGEGRLAVVGLRCSNTAAILVVLLFVVCLASYGLLCSIVGQQKVGPLGRRGLSEQNSKDLRSKTKRPKSPIGAYLL